jgi:four helix bundle protein
MFPQNRQPRSSDELIPKHGGYKNLKSYQIAELCFEVTKRFCKQYINPRDRTHDQMVQAARSGSRNIAEGSVASGTSKKSELKLTNVARASLQELKLDFEAYLRDASSEPWPFSDPLRDELIARRCQTVEEVAEWIREVHGRYGSRGVHARPSSSILVHIVHTQTSHLLRNRSQHCTCSHHGRLQSSRSPNQIISKGLLRRRRFYRTHVPDPK